MQFKCSATPPRLLNEGCLFVSRMCTAYLLPLTRSLAHSFHAVFLSISHIQTHTLCLCVSLSPFFFGLFLSHAVCLSLSTQLLTHLSLAPSLSVSLSPSLSLSLSSLSLS